MPQKLQVDIATLAKKTEWLIEQKNILLQERKRLKECLENICLYWDGVAVRSFGLRVNKDIYMLEKYLSLIDDVVFYYQTAVNKYRNNEDQISDILRAINVE